MATSKAKPYKLKPSDGIMTRDDVSHWEYTMLAACRQVADWQQFLPPNGEHREWISTDEDEHNGLEHDNAATQRKLRKDFANFLTCLATHCPVGFMDTVLRESTSFRGIVRQIKTTFNLDAKGEKFLSIMDIKFEFSPSFTYEQGYMMIKDFCMESLLPTGTIFKARALTEPEKLSPLAENFIMKEFLTKVHPRLPEYIKNTKSHLFTNERPTLACNKAIIMDLMDTMLADLENMDNLQTARVNVNQLGQNRTNPRTRGRGFLRSQPRHLLRGSWANLNGPGRGYFPPRYTTPGSRRNEDCSFCLEARRFDSSKGHSYNSCPFRLGMATPYTSSTQGRPSYGSGMKVLLIQDPNFTDMSLGPPCATGYTQQSQPNPQEEPSVVNWNYYPSEQHYAPAEIYEEGFYEEQL